MSCQNSNRKPKIVRPRIDEEAYLTLCSWVGKSNSLKIIVMDKMVNAQRGKLKELMSQVEYQSEQKHVWHEEYNNERRLKGMAEEKAKSWKSSFLILLSINVASFVFWLLAK